MTNAQIIAAFERWQSMTEVAPFPFTCGKEPKHRPLVAIERDRQVILKCPDCEYWQTEIPAVILRGGF